MTIGTSLNQAKRRTEQIMSDTVKPTNEGKNGSQKPLEPWDIAVMVCWEEGNVTVEFATDDQFQAYVEYNKIPHKDDGIAGWCFEDRCGVISFARIMGIVLVPVPNKNNSEKELFKGDEPSSGATP
jgi:hypothetical protein